MAGVVGPFFVSGGWPRAWWEIGRLRTARAHPQRLASALALPLGTQSRLAALLLASGHIAPPLEMSSGVVSAPAFAFEHVGDLFRLGRVPRERFGMPIPSCESGQRRVCAQRGRCDSLAGFQRAWRAGGGVWPEPRSRSGRTQARCMYAAHAPPPRDTPRDGATAAPPRPGLPRRSACPASGRCWRAITPRPLAARGGEEVAGRAPWHLAARGGSLRQHEKWEVSHWGPQRPRCRWHRRPKALRNK